ncbi:hypothetical protein [Geminocystis sp. NIES-3709]|uniref:hypothetical protein n=1 Tax=Geminocystis sp. NIES-3709 TaxID=1617448 RepID=UPI0005FCB507|nr:hypothetical protein [Geminocystis sp. NIES-3709]BAQ64811.1 hypothetical protein GM3709_1576 [Geminocystis sp. NIES-3709]
MVKYTLTIINKEDNHSYSYSLQLNQNQEDNPEVIFKDEITASMKKQLENQSSTILNDYQLQQIINTWIEDIKEGYRSTPIHLQLKSILDEKLKLLIDLGNQDIPNLISPDLENIEPSEGVLPPLSSIFYL